MAATAWSIGFGVHADGNRQRLEEPEQRAQLVVDDERVLVVPASRGEQHRRLGQGRLIDQVDEGLEEPGVRAPVDRGGDDEQVGSGDRVECGRHRRRTFAADDRCREVDGERREFDDLRVDLPGCGDGVEDVSQQCGGGGRRPQAPRDGDDGEGGGRGHVPTIAAPGPPNIPRTLDCVS